MGPELLVEPEVSRPHKTPATSARELDTGAWPKISFPQISVIGSVEDAFRKFFDEQIEPPCLLLDLSSCAYIEIATLQYLIAIVRDRKLRGLDTGLKLPAGHDGLRLRHFIRRWNYAEAMQAATGWRFREVVDARDVRKYFQTEAGGGDAGNPYEGAQVIYFDRFGEKIFSREAYRFFGFTTWRIGDGSDGKSVVENVRGQWKQADQSVTEILKRQLKRPVALDAAGITVKELDSENYVVSRIVFEAMTNAVRHPGASVIQTSSHMAQKPISDDRAPNHVRWVDNFFTLVYWDDGQSMLSTLKSAVARELSIFNPTEITASYLTAYDNQDRTLRGGPVFRNRMAA